MNLKQLYYFQFLKFKRLGIWNRNYEGPKKIKVEQTKGRTK